MKAHITKRHILCFVAFSLILFFSVGNSIAQQRYQIGGKLEFDVSTREHERIAVGDRKGHWLEWNRIAGTNRSTGADKFMDGAQRPLDQVFSDRRDAVRRRGHDLGLLDRLVDALRLLAGDLARAAAGRDGRAIADLAGRAAGDAAEVSREAGAQVSRLGVAEHLHQHAELDAVGVRLDLRRLGGDLVAHARKDVLGAVLLGLGGDVGDLGVGIRQGDLSDVSVHGVLPTAVGPLELDLYARPVSFKNQTGDAKYDYLQDAIPNLLITNLEQSSCC